jgi:hypothetical protein
MIQRLDGNRQINPILKTSSNLFLFHVISVKYITTNIKQIRRFHWIGIFRILLVGCLLFITIFEFLIR